MRVGSGFDPGSKPYNNYMVWIRVRYRSNPDPTNLKIIKDFGKKYKKLKKL